ATSGRVADDRGGGRLVRVSGGDAGPVDGPLPRGRALGLGAPEPAAAGDQGAAGEAATGRGLGARSPAGCRAENQWTDASPSRPTQTVAFGGRRSDPPPGVAGRAGDPPHRRGSRSPAPLA